MAADEHLNGQQFFHGSPKKISGQVTNPQVGDDQHAYFTTDQKVAEHFALRGGRSGPRTPRETGYVYSVEPTGPYKRDPDTKSGYKSPHPLNVGDVQVIGKVK